MRILVQLLSLALLCNVFVTTSCANTEGTIKEEDPELDRARQWAGSKVEEIEAYEDRRAASSRRKQQPTKTPKSEEAETSEDSEDSYTHYCAAACKTASGAICADANRCEEGCREMFCPHPPKGRRGKTVFRN